MRFVLLIGLVFFLSSSAWARPEISDFFTAIEALPSETQKKLRLYWHSGTKVPQTLLFTTAKKTTLLTQAYGYSFESQPKVKIPDVQARPGEVGSAKTYYLSHARSGKWTLQAQTQTQSRHQAAPQDADSYIESRGNPSPIAWIEDGAKFLLSEVHQIEAEAKRLKQKSLKERDAYFNQMMPVIRELREKSKSFFQWTQGKQKTKWLEALRHASDALIQIRSPSASSTPTRGGQSSPAHAE